MKRCPFYGKHAVPLMRILAEQQNGNECALITDRYAPCRLEMEGDPAPALENCEFSGSARAIEFADFETQGMRSRRYPD